MSKSKVSVILGIIAIFCILPWVLGNENSAGPLILGIIIILGLFIYLFLGKEKKYSNIQ